MNCELTLNDFEIGEEVLFGKQNGEKTRAEVIKINRKKLKVKTLEERGTRKTYPVGMEWGVPPSLCYKLDEDYVPAKKVKKSRGTSEKSLEELTINSVEVLESGCDLSNPPTYIKASRRYLEGHSVTKHKCEYDSQRQKLYRAERGVNKGKQFSNIHEARTFIQDKVIGARWFERRFGEDVSVRLEMTQGWTRSYCRREEGLIRLLDAHLNERVLIHELTHALTPRPHGGHGRLFCAIYLDLVRHFLGEDTYDELLEGYRKEGVKYRPHRTVKR